MSKSKELLDLAKLRQCTRWAGYGAIGDYHAKAYECDHVSPYTKTAGNVDSDLFFMLQDWSSHSFLSKPVNAEVRERGFAPNLPTNRNFAALLRAHFGRELCSVYVTNLFPFVKLGGLTSEVAKADLIRAANEFALPQVLVVRPAFVVCFGLATFNALRAACNQPTCNSVAEAVRSEFVCRGIQFWAQAHPGHFGQLSRKAGDPNRVAEDWQRMRAAFDARTDRAL